MVELEGYKTVKETVSAEIEVKRSRFIATVCPCKTELEATSFISQIKKKYWDAKHNVYAFTIRANGAKRFSDDGEPHSTAGLPVMETVEHFGIIDVAVVVTRYFGGILLGTGGLVRAYSDAAKAALLKAQIVNYLPAKRFKVICDYSDYDMLVKLAAESGAQVISTEFSERVEIMMGIKATDFESFEIKCTDIFCGRLPSFSAEDIFLGF